VTDVDHLLTRLARGLVEGSEDGVPLAARFCRAASATLGCDGAAITVERTRRRAFAAARIGVGPRVGIDYAGEWRHRPLRFWLRGNAHVSG